MKGRALPPALLLAGVLFFALPTGAGLVHGVAGQARAQIVNPKIELFDLTGTSLETVYDEKRHLYGAPVLDWSKFEEFHRQPREPEVLISIIDSGVVTHHPLIRKILVKSRDFTGEGPEDRLGHGTVIALLAVANAPIAGILNAKVVAGNSAATGGLDTLLEAISWSVNEGAEVINISAGVFIECLNVRGHGPQSIDDEFSCEKLEICKAITRLKIKALVVAAVGNTVGRTGCPACCADALAVGATDEKGVPLPTNGRYSDILAPGIVRVEPYSR